MSDNKTKMCVRNESDAPRISINSFNYARAVGELDSELQKRYAQHWGREPLDPDDPFGTKPNWLALVLLIAGVAFAFHIA